MNHDQIYRIGRGKKKGLRRRRRTRSYFIWQIWIFSFLVSLFFFSQTLRMPIWGKTVFYTYFPFCLPYVDFSSQWNDWCGFGSDWICEHLFVMVEKSNNKCEAKQTSDRMNAKKSPLSLSLWISAKKLLFVYYELNVFGIHFCPSVGRSDSMKIYMAVCTIQAMVWDTEQSIRNDFCLGRARWFVVPVHHHSIETKLVSDSVIGTNWAEDSYTHV